MELSLLADDPAAATRVAHWYFEQWIAHSSETPLAAVVQQVASFTSRHGPPMLLLAKQSGQLVGAAELKVREMSIYPQYEHWLGGVYVAAEHRGNKIAAKLVEGIKLRALQAGIRELYLQTESLDGGLYAHRGFQPVEQVHYKGHDVLVMKADLQ